MLGAGVAAATGGQPYGVYYPLLLCGGLLVLLLGCLTPVLIVRYAQADQRRLDAEEFRRRA
ncbi:MAG: hypothetical protein KAS72_10625 [Phycisphaerales bacterium]|nr:hypothetical protein [Phycisphaerales bacterium]